MLNRFKFFIWYFGQFKVPLIGHLRPKLLTLNDKELVILLRLNRRSKNHLNSMYFGALAMGADLAGGLYGFYHAKLLNKKITLAFKSFQAQFIKRPHADVYFVCQMGDVVKEMILRSSQQQGRVNQPIDVQAYTNYPKNPELVAAFTLELSLKVLN